MLCTRFVQEAFRILGRVVIVDAEQQLTIYAFSAESVNAAMHAPTVSFLVRSDQKPHTHDVMLFVFRQKCLSTLSYYSVITSFTASKLQPHIK